MPRTPSRHLADVSGRQRKLNLAGRDLLGEPMDRVEFLARLLVGALVAFGSKRPLTDVDDEEGRVETALDHLGQVDLGVQPLRVVPFRGEVGRADVVVRVERDHLVLDRVRFLDEGVFVALVRDRDRRGHWTLGAQRSGNHNGREKDRGRSSCDPPDMHVSPPLGMSTPGEMISADVVEEAFRTRSGSIGGLFQLIH